MQWGLATDRHFEAIEQEGHVSQPALRENRLVLSPFKEGSNAIEPTRSPEAGNISHWRDMEENRPRLLIFSKWVYHTL